MTYLLALDQGTSSSRSIVFDAMGNIVAMAQRELPQIFPQPGWVEHDPVEIWRSQLATAQEAIAKAGLQASDIKAIGITNQRETTVVWNRKTGLPIHHAIVWQDRRAEPTCVQLREQGLAGTIQQKTGLLIDAYFSGTKLKWLLDNVPNAREQAKRGELAFGTIDSWLIWQLTQGAVHATDVSNASRTMLFNVHTNQWDSELLAAMDIPPKLLPRVHPSSFIYGNTHADLLGASIPIGGVAGDQQSALFGQACFKSGMAKNTYGTGCFMQSVPDSGGVMMVPAFTGLGAPYWQADARGTITGLTRGSTMAHIVRAALESIAFQSAALLLAMSRDAVAAGAAPVSELRVDGGACTNDLLMQFQADLLGIPVLRPAVIETTALGAAYLAGLAVGVFQNTDALSKLWRVDRRFLPTMTQARAAELMANWEHAVRQATAL